MVLSGDLTDKCYSTRALRRFRPCRTPVDRAELRRRNALTWSWSATGVAAAITPKPC